MVVNVGEYWCDAMHHWRSSGLVLVVQEGEEEEEKGRNRVNCRPGSRGKRQLDYSNPYTGSRESACTGSGPAAPAAFD